MDEGQRCRLLELLRVAGDDPSKIDLEEVLKTGAFNTQRIKQLTKICLVEIEIRDTKARLDADGVVYSPEAIASSMEVSYLFLFFCIVRHFWVGGWVSGWVNEWK